LRSEAIKALDKGGLVLVNSPDADLLITAYVLNSYRRRTAS
jgi:hypothetical protein